jgi:recombination protein RecA
MSARTDQLNKIMDRMNRQAKKENPDGEPVVFVAGGNEHLLDYGLLATGNPAADLALGGGAPRGTIMQVAGQEGTGKTCFAFDMIAHNQKLAKATGGEFIPVYIHNESKAFPLTAALRAGVDIDSLYIINVQHSGEATFNKMMQLLWDWDKQQPLNLVDMVVIDSVAAASPEAELKSAKEDFGNITVGRHAAMMSKALRILSGSGALGKCLLVLINQQRTGIETWGSTTVSTGGRAMGYYPKISIVVKRPNRGKITQGKGDKEEVVGHLVTGVVEKNNTQIGKPQAKFEYKVIYGEGVDVVLPVMEAALRLSVIQQTSTVMYEIQYGGDLVKIKGRDNVEQRLRDDAEFFEYVQEQVTQAMCVATDAVAPEATGSLEDIPDEDGDELGPDGPAAATEGEGPAGLDPMDDF